MGGFYLGTWAGDVDTGIEYDIYTGYVHEFSNGFYLGAGGTSYQYSDNFDSEYNEGNFYVGWSNDAWSIDLEYSDGEYNGQFIDESGADEGDSYNFFAATLDWNGLYLTYGDFGDDADEQLGDYVEFGYGFEVVGFEVTAALVYTDLDMDPGELLNSEDGDETEFYVGIHRGFDIKKWGG